MQDGFTQLIDEATTFFTALERNNKKEWFDPRKDHYVSTIRKPAELFADLMAEDLSHLTGATHKPKVFRIYRDVRFSADKRPYNAHLHILWAQGRGDAFAPGYFFACEPGDLFVGFGITDLKGPDLTRWRAFVDVRGDDLVEAIARSGMTLSDWGGPPLKRVPKPFDPEHPHADLLKRKSLLVSRPLGQAWRGTKDGLIGAVRDAFAACRPLADLLGEVP